MAHHGEASTLLFESLHGHQEPALFGRGVTRIFQDELLLLTEEDGFEPICRRLGRRIVRSDRHREIVVTDRGGVRTDEAIL